MIQHLTHTIVVAGGRALRLLPSTATMPKCLVTVLGRPLLRYQLEWLAFHGITDVTVACDSRHHDLLRSTFDGQEVGVRLRFSSEETALGKSGATKLAIRRAGPFAEPVLVVNGDLLTTIDLPAMLEHHFASAAVATIAAVPLVSTMGILTLDGRDTVTAFVEKPQLSHWANAGVYILAPACHDDLPEEGDETAFFPPLIRRGLVAAFRSSSYYRAVDTAKDVIQAQDELRSKSWPERLRNVDETGRPSHSSLRSNSPHPPDTNAAH